MTGESIPIHCGPEAAALQHGRAGLVLRKMHYTQPMRLHPRRTHLFEVYTPRHQTVHALEALAQTLPSKEGIEHGFETAQGGLTVSFEVDLRESAGESG